MYLANLSCCMKAVWLYKRVILYSVTGAPLDPSSSRSPQRFRHARCNSNWDGSSARTKLPTCRSVPPPPQQETNLSNLIRSKRMVASSWRPLQEARRVGLPTDFLEAMCIQGPSATVGETHGLGYASP